MTYKFITFPNVLFAHQRKYHRIVICIPLVLTNPRSDNTVSRIRWHKENKNGIITCSALKKSYRTILIRGRDSLKQETGEMEKVQEEGSETEMDLSNTILFVYLKGSQEVIAQRIGSRKGHFMPASLLNSQFKTLEEPNGDENYIDVDVTQDVNEITDSLLDYISQKSSYFEI